MLAVDDFLETLDGVLKFDVAAFLAGELSGNEERLRQESLNLTRAGYRQFILCRTVLSMRRIAR